MVNNFIYQQVINIALCNNNMRIIIEIMKSTKVQTLGRNIGTFGLETNLHAYVLGIYRTSFQHNLHCFIDACVHVVNDYIVSN